MAGGVEGAPGGHLRAPQNRPEGLLRRPPAASEDRAAACRAILAATEKPSPRPRVPRGSGAAGNRAIAPALALPLPVCEGERPKRPVPGLIGPASGWTRGLQYR